MEASDYRALIDASKTFSGMKSIAGVYGDGDGVQYRSDHRDNSFFHEAVRLSDWAFLLLTELAPREDRCHTQVVGGEDLLHVQFRFRGKGYEQVADNQLVETPERSCIVSRYPKGSVVERQLQLAESWKYACFYLRPSAFTSLLEIAEADLTETTSWMGTSQQSDFRSDTFPLGPSLLAPLRDIFSCGLRAPLRRAYMRGKSLEILSTVVDTLDRRIGADNEGAVRLSTADLAKLAQARTIMDEHPEDHLSLAGLARRVGLNRTKLALGFKATYGDPVQAYWRDVRLARARDMLQSGSVCVTEAAFGAGYREISSFTRAFTRKFGVLPKACKR